MTEVDVLKLEIASEYLEAAIGFFLAGTNYFCAIHLSAAAEELFGAHLPEGQRIFTSAWKAEKALMSETDQSRRGYGDAISNPQLGGLRVSSPTTPPIMSRERSAVRAAEA